MTSGASTKWVYDFSEGSKDQKDLLGGKGANLAEMTNLGLPVPPGFTITTDACRYYLEHGGTPPELDQQVSEHLAALEKAMGKTLGDPADPLLVSVRSGAAASMPGMMETVLNVGLNDESVEGLAAAVGQRAVRLGLLPPADPDVRQDRARHRRRALRARPRRGEARAGHRPRPRPRRRAPQGRRRPVQGDRPRAHRPRLPDGPARADGPGDQRRLRLVELRPRDHLPPPRAHPQRRRHRRQHLLDGVRQPRRRLRHRRRLHPRPGQRRAGRLRRLPAERPGRGRRRRHPQHRAAGRPGEHRQGRLRRADVDHVAARVALPRPVRHRVHHRAQQALDAADPRRASGRRPPPSSSPPSWSTRASSTWTRPCAG